MTGIEKAAAEAAEWFETADRYEGEPGRDVETFVRLKDGRPEWVLDLVRDAHGDEFLPDDWRYAKVQDALLFIGDTEGMDEDERAHEFADQAVDVYTSDRLAWLASNLQRPGIVDEAVSELGAPEPFDIVSAIGLGQYSEARDVFAAVWRSLEARAAEHVDA